MAFKLTNAHLIELLEKLDFKSGDFVNDNYRRWHHPESGCELLLPTNKTNESPRPADLVGIKAQLDLQGHLGEDAFDSFVAEGTLPAPSARHG